MKSNIWETTGKTEANSRGEGALPPGTPPGILVPAPLTFMGSSAEHRALRRINNAVAARTNKREHPVFCERETEELRLSEYVK